MDSIGKPESNEELLQLLKLFADAVEGTKGEQVSERVVAAEGLAHKIFFHSISAYYLSRSTTVNDFPGNRLSFFDPASFAVLVRAALESLLTFHLVYIEPGSVDGSELRYMSWKLAALLERQRFPVSEPENVRQKNEEAKLIDALKKQIEKNTVAKGLPEPVQKALANGEWRVDFARPKRTILAWKDMGEKAGLSKLLSSDFYRLLCEWAHSGHLSVWQLWHAKTKEDQLRLMDAGLSLLKVILANSCFFYAALRTAAKAHLLQSPVLRLAEMWREVGRSVDIP